MGNYMNILIRVYNEKYDMTYIYNLLDRDEYKNNDYGHVIEFAKNKCTRWMRDKFGATEEDLKDIQTEELFTYYHDAILHNDYFHNAPIMQNKNLKLD